MKFINENLKRTLNNINNVVSIEPRRVENTKMALFALLKIKDNMYEYVALSEPESIMSFDTFGLEPIKILFADVVPIFSDNFIDYNGFSAFNKNHLEKFIYSYDTETAKKVVMAKYKDGAIEILFKESVRRFRHTRKQLNKLMEANGIFSTDDEYCDINDENILTFDENGFANLPTLAQNDEPEK